MWLFILVRLLLAMNGILFSVSQKPCSSHNDCNSDYVCCKSIVSTELRCRKIFNATKLTRSCIGYYCTDTSDCQGLIDGQKLCCRSSQCTFCPGCLSHSDCRQSRFCCAKPRYEQSRCSRSCLGEICQTNSDCAVDECCRFERCVKCSYRDCKSHSECPTGQFCCDKRNFRGQCKWKCVEDYCLSDEDCAFSEHCDSYKCHKGMSCRNGSMCSDGSYCCKLNWYTNAVCRHSCIGNPCVHDDDCGPSNECCLNNQCLLCGDSCTSSVNCLSGAVCCKGALSSENKCASKCDKESCVLSSQCVKHGAWCVEGTCSHTKQCNFTSDCVVATGEQYYCCIDDNSHVKMCRKGCITRQCSSDRDCPSTECCSSNGMCTAKIRCLLEFPSWLIALFVTILIAMVAVIVIICCYSHRKMLQLNRRQSAQNAEENTQVPDIECERVQNVYHEPPNETPAATNTRLPVPRTEVEEQIYYPISNENNEFIEMVALPPPHIQNNVNNRNEYTTPPPLYTPNDPSVNNGHRSNTPNISPPPYSSEGQAVSGEYDNLL